MLLGDSLATLKPRLDPTDGRAGREPQLEGRAQQALDVDLEDLVESRRHEVNVSGRRMSSDAAEIGLFFVRRRWIILTRHCSLIHQTFKISSLKDCFSFHRVFTLLCKKSNFLQVQ